MFLCFKRQVKSRMERVLSTFRYIPTSIFIDGKQAFDFKGLMNESGNLCSLKYSFPSYKELICFWFANSPLKITSISLKEESKKTALCPMLLESLWDLTQTLQEKHQTQ